MPHISAQANLPIGDEWCQRRRVTVVSFRSRLHKSPYSPALLVRRLTNELCSAQFASELVAQFRGVRKSQRFNNGLYNPKLRRPRCG